MSRNNRGFALTALPIVVFALMAGSAMAQSYSGDWPTTVSNSHYANGTYCVTLTDDGSLGWPHSGGAVLLLQSNRLFGTFQVINGLLMATFEQQGGTGQNAGLVFIARASGGRVKKGTYEEVYGGEELDSGVLVFGAKNGCSGH